MPCEPYSLRAERDGFTAQICFTKHGPLEKGSRHNHAPVGPGLQDPDAATLDRFEKLFSTLDLATWKAAARREDYDKVQLANFFPQRRFADLYEVSPRVAIHMLLHEPFLPEKEDPKNIRWHPLPCNLHPVRANLKRRQDLISDINWVYAEEHQWRPMTQIDKEARTEQRDKYTADHSSRFWLPPDLGMKRTENNELSLPALAQLLRCLSPDSFLAMAYCPLVAVFDFLCRLTGPGAIHPGDDIRELVCVLIYAYRFRPHYVHDLLIKGDSTLDSRANIERRRDDLVYTLYRAFCSATDDTEQVENMAKAKRMLEHQPGRDSEEALIAWWVTTNRQALQAEICSQSSAQREHLGSTTLHGGYYYRSSVYPRDDQRSYCISLDPAYSGPWETSEASVQFRARLRPGQSHLRSRMISIPATIPSEGLLTASHYFGSRREAAQRASSLVSNYGELFTRKLADLRVLGLIWPAADRDPAALHNRFPTDQKPDLLPELQRKARSAINKVILAKFTDQDAEYHSDEDDIASVAFVCITDKSSNDHSTNDNKTVQDNVMVDTPATTSQEHEIRSKTKGRPSTDSVDRPRWTLAMALTHQDFAAQAADLLWPRRAIVAEVYLHRPVDSIPIDVLFQNKHKMPPLPAIDHPMWTPGSAPLDIEKVPRNLDFRLDELLRYHCIHGPISSIFLPPFGTHVEDCDIPHLIKAYKGENLRKRYHTTFMADFEAVMKMRRPFGRPYMVNGKIARYGNRILMGSAEYAKRFPASAEGREDKKPNESPWLIPGIKHFDTKADEGQDRARPIDGEIDWTPTAEPAIPIMPDLTSLTIEEIKEVYDLAMADDSQIAARDFIHTVSYASPFFSTHVPCNGRKGPKRQLKRQERATMSLLVDEVEDDWNNVNLRWSLKMLQARLRQKEALGLKILQHELPAWEEILNNYPQTGVIIIGGPQSRAQPDTKAGPTSTDIPDAAQEAGAKVQDAAGVAKTNVQDPGQPAQIDIQDAALTTQLDARTTAGVAQTDHQDAGGLAQNDFQHAASVAGTEVQYAAGARVNRSPSLEPINNYRESVSHLPRLGANKTLRLTDLANHFHQMESAVDDLHERMDNHARVINNHTHALDAESQFSELQAAQEVIKTSLLSVLNILLPMQSQMNRIEAALTQRDADDESKGKGEKRKFDADDESRGKRKKRKFDAVDRAER